MSLVVRQNCEPVERGAFLIGEFGVIAVVFKDGEAEARTVGGGAQRIHRQATHDLFLVTGFEGVEAGGVEDAHVVIQILFAIQFDGAVQFGAHVRRAQAQIVPRH